MVHVLLWSLPLWRAHNVDTQQLSHDMGVLELPVYLEQQQLVWCASASVCCASSFCDIGRYTAKPHTALGVGAELPFPNTWETDHSIVTKI